MGHYTVYHQNRLADRGIEMEAYRCIFPSAKYYQRWYLNHLIQTWKWKLSLFFSKLYYSLKIYSLLTFCRGKRDWCWLFIRFLFSRVLGSTSEFVWSRIIWEMCDLALFPFQPALRPRYVKIAYRAIKQYGTSQWAHYIIWISIGYHFIQMTSMRPQVD